METAEKTEASEVTQLKESATKPDDRSLILGTQDKEINDSWKLSSDLHVHACHGVNTHINKCII